MPLFTSDELTANAPLPVPSIIGRGLFPECGTWLITGKTECGKSVIAFDIAISLVLQQPLFRAMKGQGEKAKALFPVNHPCKVLYLDSELGPQGCHQRLKLFQASRNIAVPLGDYFQIVTGEFKPLLLHETASDKKPFENLRQLVGDTKPQVLIIDPFGDYHLVDEDSNHMRMVFRYLRSIQNEFKTASIVLHHESDKQIFDNRGMPIEKEGTGRSRGHSSIAQSVDTYLSLKRVSKAPYTFLEANWEKVRHQTHPPSGWLFVDFQRMYVEWVLSNRAGVIAPAHQAAFLNEYEKKNGKASMDED